MQLTKTHKIIISIVTLIILLGIYVLIDRKSRNIQSEPTNNTSNEPATTTNKTTVANVEATGNYKIEQVSATEGAGVPQPVPDLDRKVVVYSGAIVSGEAKTIATAKILDLQAQLKKNTADIKSWINLGIYQKMAGDYNGAMLSWKYASRLSPSDYVPLGNLGNLYAYFIKDNVKAESYLKEAISKGPIHSNLYVALAEFYRDLLNDKTKALAIINQGLAKIPNDPNLLQLQSSLQ